MDYSTVSGKAGCTMRGRKKLEPEIRQHLNRDARRKYVNLIV
jgi:hypothetical protein